ncbi:hypothetical protein DES36_12633 [Alkalibaculum bacchi]|uniref:Hydrolase n=1 Tax=Alkalibaculum bacchi TaxID=645887 RepID=A0A366HYZ7_9FIRM|nr:hydrolase [Alkalibaculum bacchi]RBP57961.1 hypothetical protein DES36_12633 [Alkalibaculum bacchi]
MEKYVPEIMGNLRKNIITVPEIISKVSGIKIFGKRIKSILFTTDVAIIKNCNANAIIAVYPFTPQPIISHSIILASDVPVFCGVGGGTTIGKRVVNLAMDAEFQGAMGVVLNAPTPNRVVRMVKDRIDIPIILTVVSINTDFKERIEAGATIFNVSAGSHTPDVVKRIREEFPFFPIIATGGPNDESILKTIEAGANAITYTPPSTSSIFKKMMNDYRQE